MTCTAVQRVPSKAKSQRAFVQFEVEPASAEIYVDEQYKGKVKGWADGVVPLVPGEHRVKVTAEGYITQRFDVTLEEGDSKRLKLEMEPKLESFPDEPEGK